MSDASVNLLPISLRLNVMVAATIRVIYKDYREGSGEMPVQGQVG